MSIRVTHVHMSPGGTAHEHIESVRWEEQGINNTGAYTVAQMVDFLDRNGKAFTLEGGTRAEIYVRRNHGTKPFIQTASDGVWSNNLLSLPRF